MITRIPYLLLTALAAFTTQAAADIAPPKTPTLEVELKRVYAGWSKSMLEQDKGLWRKNTANYRKIGTRNLIVSQGKKWPDALFHNLVTPADVSTLKLARVMENGPTAQLVYYGKADFGADKEVEIPDGLLILMFVEEESGWKFNTSRFMSLAGAEEIGDSATTGDFSFLDAPEFKPPGEIPPLPKICPIPEVVGFIEIVALGYEATVKIDDRSEHTVINNVQTGLITGGLKHGNNTIFVETRPLPLPPGAPPEKDKQRHFEFTIYRKPPRPDEPPKEIYTSGKITKPGKIKAIIRGGE